jgi:hypothetical protein
VLRSWAPSRQGSGRREEEGADGQRNSGPGPLYAFGLLLVFVIVDWCKPVESYTPSRYSTGDQHYAWLSWHRQTYLRPGQSCMHLKAILPVAAARLWTEWKGRSGQHPRRTPSSLTLLQSRSDTRSFTSSSTAGRMAAGSNPALLAHQIRSSTAPAWH